MGKKSLERQALDRMGKNWSKADGTREKLLNNTRHFARFVQDKYHLERIENLKPGMITAYAASMTKQGLSGSTTANRMTAVREVCAAIGKQGICAKENSPYGIERVRVNPQQVNVDKLIEIRGALAERAAAGERIAKMMVAADGLREAFGLRAKESLMSKEIVVRDGKQYLIVEGAKGGRPRELLVDNEAKERAVQVVSETSKELGSGYLVTRESLRS
jgi:site-specific recombinase XerC